MQLKQKFEEQKPFAEKQHLMLGYKENTSK